MSSGTKEVIELSNHGSGLGGWRGRVFVLALVMGVLLWNIEQARSLGRAQEQLRVMQAQLDGTNVALKAASARLAAQEKRMHSVEDQALRSWGGVRQSELVVTRSWIRRLEGQVDDNTRRLVELTARFDPGSGS